MAPYKSMAPYDFEQISFEASDTIWVLKYDLYFDETGNFCTKDTPNAKKFTDCHGWYETEEDAVFVQSKMHALGSTYNVERVYKRNVNR